MTISQVRNRITEHDIIDRIEIIKKENPQLKKLNLQFLELNDHFFDIVTHEFKDLNIKSVKAGVETNRLSKIYKNYEYIFCRCLITESFKVIKVAKCTIGYKDIKCLIYADENILAFSSLNYLDLQEIVSVSDYGSKYDLFLSLYHEKLPKLNDLMF